MNLPLDTKLGKVLDELIDLKNASYFIEKLKAQGFKYEKTSDGGFNMHKFVTKKNFWGALEYTIIQESDDKVFIYTIFADSVNSEFIKVSDYIYQNNFEELKRDNTITYYHFPIIRGYIIGIGNNVNKAGDAYMVIINKLVFL